MRSLRVPEALSTHLAVMAGSSVVVLTGVTTGVISARWLGPVGRGEYTAAFTWAAFVGVVVSVGVPQGLVVDSGKLARLVRPLMVHMALALTGSTSVGILLASTQQPWLTPMGVVGIGLIGAGGAAGSIAAGLAQRLGRMRLYFQLARALPPTGVVLTMLVLILVGSSSPNVWLLLTGTMLFLTGSGLLFASLPVGSPLEKAWTYDAAFRATSLGAFAVTVITQAVYRLDSLVVALVAAPRDVAFYAVGVAALGGCSAIAQTAGMIAFSKLRTSHTSAMRREVWHSCLQALLSVTAMTIPVVLFMPWLVDLLYGSEFGESVAVARLLVLAALPMSVDYVLTHVLLLLGVATGLRRLRTIQLLVGAPIAWLVADYGGLAGLATLMICMFVISAAGMTQMTLTALGSGIDDNNP